MEKFRYKSYYKSELAQLFFPDSSAPHIAENRLVRWMKADAGLMDALSKVNYRKTRKFFSAREVRLICEYLGEPF